MSKLSFDPEKFWANGRPREWADGFIRDLHRNRSLLTTRETELVALGILDGLLEAFPEAESSWRQGYPFAFEGAEVVRLLTNERTDGRPGWNDYYMARWFLSHDRRHVVSMLNRIQLPNPDIGGSCIWMLRSCSIRHPELAQQVRDAVFGDECPWVRDNFGSRFDEILGTGAIAESRAAESRLKGHR